jgi:hypothetical protein
VVLLGFVVSACVSKGYWTGVSTGGTAECAPFNFELTTRSNQITGSLETITEDPRIRRPRLFWAGTAKPLRLSLAEQGSDELCPTPRSATLKRR